MSSATHAALWAALEALVKPVTRDDVLTAAGNVLNGKELSGFRAWFADHEPYLLGRLNNGG